LRTGGFFVKEAMAYLVGLEEWRGREGAAETERALLRYEAWLGMVKEMQRASFKFRLIER